MRELRKKKRSASFKKATLLYSEANGMSTGFGTFFWLAFQKAANASEMIRCIKNGSLPLPSDRLTAW